MQITPRDLEILETIYRYDGILSVDQVHRWFFGAKRRAYYRIAALCEHQCLQRLKPQERYRVPEPIVWLGKAGAEIVAGRLDIDYKDLRWRSKPRWSRVAHDIALNEFRHMFQMALKSHPFYDLESWHGQDALEPMFPEPLPYRDYIGEVQEKIVKPDGYVSVRVVANPEYPFLLRFLVELDNNTESNRRFGRDKVSPLVHLLMSEQYQRELGSSGRVMVVTVGSETRFHNLRSEVTKYGGAAYFIFTRSEWVQPDTVLDQPIWYLPHVDTRFTFQQYHSDTFQAFLTRSLNNVLRLNTL